MKKNFDGGRGKLPSSHPSDVQGLEIKPLDKSGIGKGERFERRGKTGFFVKRNLSIDDTKKTLKTIAEGEIRVNTDEYSTRA